MCLGVCSFPSATAVMQASITRRQRIHTDVDTTLDKGHVVVTEVIEKIRTIDHLANVSNLYRRMR